MKRIAVLVTLILAITLTVVACGGAPAAPASATTAPSGAKPAAPVVAKPAPKPGSTPAAHNADFDKDVADVAKAVGFTKYEYEAFSLTAATKWDDVFSYYDGEMVKAGWQGHGSVSDIDGGKMGAFVNKETHTGLVIFFLASPDGTKPAFSLAIFGQ